MNAIGQDAWSNQARSRREVIDMPEQKPIDKSLDKLIAVRKHRLNRLELECREMREQWRTARVALRERKMCWRSALQESKSHWNSAREEFFKMTTTSGQFRKAKAVYERMKAHAAQLHLESREAVIPCKAQRAAFFQVRRDVLNANRQQEKLCILRDEMRLSNPSIEL